MLGVRVSSELGQIASSKWQTADCAGCWILQPAPCFAAPSMFTVWPFRSDSLTLYCVSPRHSLLCRSSVHTRSGHCPTLRQRGPAMPLPAPWPWSDVEVIHDEVQQLSAAFLLSLVQCKDRMRQLSHLPPQPPTPDFPPAPSSGSSRRRGVSARATATSQPGKWQRPLPGTDCWWVQ